MKIESEFSLFLKDRGILLTEEQELVARAVLNSQGCQSSWMRARGTGVSFLFKTLEEFFKHHIPKLQ